MVHMPWKDYVVAQIVKFRNRYESLPEKTRKLAGSIEKVISYSLNEPTQVIVVEFAGGPYPYYFIILHTNEYPDMEVKAFERVALKNFPDEIFRDDQKLQDLVDNGVIEKIEKEMRTYPPFEEIPTWICGAHDYPKSSLFMYNSAHEELEFFKGKKGLSYWLWEFIKVDLEEHSRQELRESISETVNDIRKDTQAIQVNELKEKIAEKTVRLKDEIEKLDKKTQDQFDRIRKLIGTSEKYLDWRVFSSDIEQLKQTHVPKGEFDIEIKRLNERIDALNTRIADLREVKLARTRTILEVALGIATITSTLVAALLAAHIL